jgi:competence protein ComEA
MIHVTGAVVSPGMYALPAGVRMQDALVAAGGLLPEADTALINLAAFLDDGQQIWVPWKQEAPDAAKRVETIPDLSEKQSPSATPVLGGPININLATQTELESLPGIGPAIAQRIIEYRQQFGPFQKIEEIKAVNGIGDAKFDQIKEYITVGQPP